MANSISTPADPFAYHPFLMLMPVKGKLARLEALTSSLFARLEKVQLARNESSSHAEDFKAIEAELNMLKQVLDWVNPRNMRE